MKSFESYLDEATEAQARASNPNAPPELIRRAAERSQRSAAQRNANQKTSQNSINKGQRSLPPASGALAKRPADKGASIVRTKQGGTSKEAIGKPRKSGPGVMQPKQDTGSKTYNRMVSPPKKSKPIPPPKKRKPIPNDRALSTKTEPGSQAQQNRNKILNNKKPALVRPLAKKAVGAALKGAGKLGKAVIGAKSASLSTEKEQRMGKSATREYGDSQY